MIGALGIVLFDHPETTLQPLIQQVRPPAARPGRRAARTGARQRPHQVHAGQLRRLQPAGGRGQAPGAPRRAVVQPGAAAGRDRHRQGTAGACHPRRRRPARSGPFVSVNIAAVPDTLLEAEFFGVAPGAYTGADRKGRDGKFKLADGGTLFLDEIGDMPPSLQPKLLRALQEGEIEPLGSNKLVPFDARVIAATSRDLAALVREGRFREDLYYRLNVLPIRVPPLRERRSRHPGAGGGAGRGHGAAQRHAAARAQRRGDGAAGGAVAGAATSASCATCWSRPPCAATSQRIEAGASGAGAARCRRGERRAAGARGRACAAATGARQPQAAAAGRAGGRGRARAPSPRRWRPPAATSWPPPACSASRAPSFTSACECAV